MDAKSFDEFLSGESFFDYSTIPQNSSDDTPIDPQAAKEYLVAFSTQSSSYCIGVVDMVNSTEICAKLGSKSSRYYQIFLNSMSKILSRFGGFVIKNVGDCLFFYFPESIHSNKKFGFLSCLEAGFAMIESRDVICQQLLKERLPPVSFRVSADYGSVIIMKPNNSESLDMIGPPVNICTKINHLARQNSFVIGSDLREMVKNFKDYSFKEIGQYSSGFKYGYPVFSVRRSNYR